MLLHKLEKQYRQPKGVFKWTLLANYTCLVLTCFTYNKIALHIACVKLLHMKIQVGQVINCDLAYISHTHIQV